MSAGSWVPSYLDRAAARTALARRGYDPGQVATALQLSAERGDYVLKRHVVLFNAELGWQVVPLPWGNQERVPAGAAPELPPMQLTDTAMARSEVLAALQRLGVDDVTAVQAIEQAPHTGDGTVLLGGITIQYTAQGAYDLWLRPELVPGAAAGRGHELARELIAKHGVDRYPTPAANFRKLLDEAGELGEAMMGVLSVLTEGGPGPDLDTATAHVRKEYGDVGLTLYELGTKLGLNLIDCMTEVVQGETRTFTHFPPASGMSDQDAIDNGIME